MSLSCIMIIKNGIRNGYPFLESIRSIVDAADEFLISDGYSDDGTYDYLCAAANKYSNIKLYQDTWPASEFGESIALVTNQLKARARCDWVYNIQADEVVHETILPKFHRLTTTQTNKFASFALRFLHFVGDFHHIETNPGYEYAVRLVPNAENVSAVSDGWTFDGNVEPVGIIKYPPLFHFGWVYSKNNLYKKKNHAENIFRGDEPCQKEYQFCHEIEKQIEEKPDAFIGWQRKLLAYRKIRRYEGGYPKVAQHLLKRDNFEYEPDPSVLDMDLSSPN